MFRGYRGFWIALAGLILLGANSPSQNSRGNPASTYTDQESRNHEKIAAGISRTSDALEAQKGSSDPYEEDRNKREIRDLEAQENSAYWAAAMFWVTLSAVVLSVIGIFLVWTTFRETQKSNDIARDHQRARILPIVELDRTHHLSETMKVTLRCENVGLSPAYRVICYALTVKEVPVLPPKDAVGGYERTIVVGAAASLIEFGNFEKDHYVVGMIQYDTIFGGPKRSYFCFGFTWSLKSRRWFAVSNIPKTWPRDT